MLVDRDLDYSGIWEKMERMLPVDSFDETSTKKIQQLCAWPLAAGLVALKHTTHTTSKKGEKKKKTERTKKKKTKKKKEKHTRNAHTKQKNISKA